MIFLVFKDMKLYLFLVIFILGQTISAQINLDTLWRRFVVDNYKKYDSYTAEIITNSTIRGKYTGDYTSVIDLKSASKKLGGLQGNTY